MAKKKKKVASQKGIVLSGLTPTNQVVTVPVEPENQLKAQVEARDGLSSGFTILTHVGDPDSGTIPHTGETVHRQEKIFVEEQGAFVDVLYYDNHFIYENPDVKVRNRVGPMYLCTCGATAGIVTSGDETVPEEVIGKFVCAFDAYTGFKGKHVTDDLNARDFESRDLSEKRRLPN